MTRRFLQTPLGTPPLGCAARDVVRTPLALVPDVAGLPVGDGGTSGEKRIT